MVRREAAGGVVYRRRSATGSEGAGDGERAVEILMVLDTYGHWALPKGGIEPDETPVMAALREIREETGVVGAAEEALPTVQYRFHDGSQEVEKTVHYFLVRALTYGLRIQKAELRDAAWLSYEEALARCSYENLRAILEAAAVRLGLAGEAAPATAGEGEKVAADRAHGDAHGDADYANHGPSTADVGGEPGEAFSASGKEHAQGEPAAEPSGQGPSQ